MTYPAWSYFPRNVRPPAWAVSFVEVVRATGAKISTVEHKTGLSSDDVLKEQLRAAAGRGRGRARRSRLDL